MPVMQVEVPFEQVLKVMDQLNEKQKTYIIKKLVPENWVKRLYALFGDVRREAEKFPDNRINSDIEEAIKEIRQRKREVKE